MGKSSFKDEGRTSKDEGGNLGRTEYWKDGILKDEGRNTEGRRTKLEGRRTEYWKDEILEGRNIEGRRTESRGTKDEIPENRPSRNIFVLGRRTNSRRTNKNRPRTKDDFPKDEVKMKKGRRTNPPL
eukprot:gene7513-biopygen276